MATKKKRTKARRPARKRPPARPQRQQPESLRLRSMAASFSGVEPRRRVPAIGWYSTCRPVTRTSISGEAPTMSQDGVARKNM